MKVGLIGLGNMGSAMARNLIKAGHDLTVYNRTRSRVEQFTSLGARIAETPSEAAADAEVLITMLADDAAVEGVIFAPGNVIQALPANAVHISMSTVSVALSRRLAEGHRDRNQLYVAATVFGRPDVAAAWKLFIVAGGPSEPIERCQPLFDAIGQKTFIAGEEAPTANQAFAAVESFHPLSNDEREALVAKTRKAEANGHFEPFKTSSIFDSTAENPQWLGEEPPELRELVPA